MPRKKKSVLNQTKEEPKLNIVVSEDDVEEVKELHDIDIVEEAKKMVSEETGVPAEEINVKVTPKSKTKEEPKEISLKVSGEKLSEVLQKEIIPEEPQEEAIEEKVDETPRPVGYRALDSDVRKRLTHRELRLYRRTGILPK